ncbi:hypothetical protein MUG87_14705 [Ectobacillus sp. JY-23]|uniref:hypothetical protein n=1 Tax=Ectobacillus sp. JY-23 TaxID=2933872 RepID=UPI001FF33EB9|nr:hypothetical protein [Ectobacillus sp. JY-23]UOY91733.1 hypothetical protein MUG87_14705 [Ectobacillus sp. JY-23]
MGFELSDWLLYTLWTVLGLMILDFVVGFIRSFWKGSFSTSLVLDYLKDIVYLIFPLNLLLSLITIDPTGWILITFYFISGIAIIIKYILDIKGKFR